METVQLVSAIAGILACLLSFAALILCVERPLGRAPSRLESVLFAASLGMGAVTFASIAAWLISCL